MSKRGVLSCKTSSNASNLLWENNCISFLKYLSLKCHLSLLPNPQGWGKRVYLYPPPPQGLAGGDRWHFRLRIHTNSGARRVSCNSTSWIIFLNFILNKSGHLVNKSYGPANNKSSLTNRFRVKWYYQIIKTSCFF